MSFCEECDRSTLELCSGNHCRSCCLRLHGPRECDRFDSEWGNDSNQRVWDDE